MLSREKPLYYNLPSTLLHDGPAILSVDVEDYFHVEAFSDIVPRSAWDSYPRRVVENTRVLLDLFDSLDVRGTFFILGWVAERHRALVAEIAARGHEIGCHSYWHRPVFQLSPEEFRADTRQAKDAIEQAGGQAVRGYRAPSFSVTTASQWALPILAELGFHYDSSIFPIRHDFYGIPNAPRHPFQVRDAVGASGQPLVECPMTTFRHGTTNFPVGGGGYLRMLPVWYTKWGIQRAYQQGLPLIAYLHPWEVDPDQPRMPGRVVSRFRHYTNLAQMTSRLRWLAGQVKFVSFAESGILDTARPADTISQAH